MFYRLKKVFGSSAGKPQADAPVTPKAVSIWASAQGFACSGLGEDKGFSITGQVGSSAWRLELGRSSREYIRGQELRARAELNGNEDVAVLIMNRALKEMLEKQAYALYTDTLQTTADPKLPEEMRWLALYQEVGWDSMSPAFLERY